jgi:Transcriptional regulators
MIIKAFVSFDFLFESLSICLNTQPTIIVVMTTVVLATVNYEEKNMDDIPLGAFISMTYRSHFVRINRKMKELGLSAGQFFVLMVLADKQGITQDHLAGILLIDKGSIARAVNVLEEKGIVKRITDENNRRAVKLYLTETGNKLIPDVVKIDREWEEAAFSGLSDEERKQAKLLLYRISENSYKAAYENGDKKWKGFPGKDQQ